jgi:hypothetical protein
MGLILCLCSFAVVYAATSEVGNWVTVYWLDFWDPKFHDQQGNIAVGRQVLPILVAIASTSCFIGARKHGARLNTRMKSAIASGVVSGFLSSAAFFAWVAITRHLRGRFEAIAIFIGQLLFLAGRRSSRMLYSIWRNDQLNRTRDQERSNRGCTRRRPRGDRVFRSDVSGRRG